MSGLPQFDDAAYDEGRKMFKKGRTVRSIIEPMIEAERERMNARRTHKGPKDYEAEDKKQEANANADFSRCIGFADAFLESLRAR